MWCIVDSLSSSWNFLYASSKFIDNNIPHGYESEWSGPKAALCPDSMCSFETIALSSHRKFLVTTEFRTCAQPCSRYAHFTSIHTARPQPGLSVTRRNVHTCISHSNAQKNSVWLVCKERKWDGASDAEKERGIERSRKSETTTFLIDSYWNIARHGTKNICQSFFSLSIK